MKKRKTARKRKTALKKKTVYVNAILKDKKSFCIKNERYDKDIPKTVDKKTARLLRATGFFKFERIVNEDKGSHQKRQEENKEKTEKS